LADLETTDDTNNITLNLMDHFLFSEENWLPELSYCRLHAACFYLASLITGQRNTIEQIAASLGEESSFVQQMAGPLAGDEEEVLVVKQILSVSIGDVEEAYALLYERSEILAGLMGEYAVGIEGLPVPKVVVAAEGDERQAWREEENFDVFDEDEGAR
jgi:hypothetical protein